MLFLQEKNLLQLNHRNWLKINLELIINHQDQRGSASYLKGDFYEKYRQQFDEISNIRYFLKH